MCLLYKIKLHSGKYFSVASYTAELKLVSTMTWRVLIITADLRSAEGPDSSHARSKCKQSFALLIFHSYVVI